MSNVNFPYPLPEHALAHFCHPQPGHDFAKAVRVDGEIWAGNGYVMLRAEKGRWIDAEIPKAGDGFLTRAAKLPWGRWDTLQAPEWRDLSDIRALIFARGNQLVWTGPPLAPYMAPTPIWRVGDVLCRLSLLQLIAKLPRCAVYAGEQDRHDPLWFRFSGGRGAVAYDNRLTMASFSILQPSRDCLTGSRNARQARPFLGMAQPNSTWPPPDLSESTPEPEPIDY